jgi:SAM-dependent methyltransferase
VRSSEAWEEEAPSWVAWARTPGHDAYWLYRDRFFELVPPPGRATLEIGCGEGRVARDLAARGHAVTALDSSPTLLAHARELGGAAFVLGHAERLPFDDAAFDLVVAHNSLMDVDDLPASVGEAARVLEPGGRFCVAVTHPLADASTWTTGDEERAFVVGQYLGKRRYDQTFERAGLSIRFRGWCYPLGDYTLALERAGFLIEALREPAAAVRPDDRHLRLPMFLYLRALKP